MDSKMVDIQNSVELWEVLIAILEYIVEAGQKQPASSKIVVIPVTKLNCQSPPSCSYYGSKTQRYNHTYYM